MPKRRKTLQDVINFILSNEPPEGEEFDDNPFSGHCFGYDLVTEALAQLRFRERLHDLEPFDIPGTRHLWRMRKGGIRYELARKGTKQLLQQLHKQEPDKPLTEIITQVTQDHFQCLPINLYKTRLSGMLQHVYENSHYNALKDLFDHDKELSEFSDLQPYDMKRTSRNTWEKKSGVKNYQLARQLTKKFLCVLMMQRNIPLEQLIPEITAKDFRTVRINRYNTTLEEMFQFVYRGSPYLALKDLFNHDSEFKEFRDLQQYDMHRACNNTWRNKDGTKNYALARKMMKAFLYVLKKQKNASWEEMFPRTRVRELYGIPLNKYGTNIRGMVEIVYGDSVYNAMKDVTVHDKRYTALSGSIETLRHRVA